MKGTKIIIYLAAAVLTVYLSGCTQSKAGDTITNTTIDVETQPVKTTDGSEAISYSGTIEESESTPLSFSVIGNVSQVLVSEGDFVRKGQLLAVLNDETYKNMYEISLSTQKKAEDAYKRLQPMYKNGNLPEIKFVEIETALEQAKIAVLIAKKNLTDCRLFSPVNGIVGKRAIDPGMSAIPNMTSLTIVKIEKVFAKVAISENEISSIKKGQIAKINISAINSGDFNGEVEEIGVMADPIAHTYKIKIGINNSKRIIKPGMICNVELEKTKGAAGMIIPESAVLVDENGENYVYAVNQNKAVRKSVKTGKLMKNGVEIISGLNTGEQIIVTGLQKLVNNSLIRVVKS